MPSLQNPLALAGIPLPGGSCERDRRISRDELNRIIAAADKTELPAVLRLAAESAMRPSEIVVTLQWEQLDLEARVGEGTSSRSTSATMRPLSWRYGRAFGHVHGRKPAPIADWSHRGRACADTVTPKRSVEATATGRAVPPARPNRWTSAPDLLSTYAKR